jgi:hypothetical protein
MDVTVLTGRKVSMRYSGKIVSRSQVALVAGSPQDK